MSQDWIALMIGNSRLHWAIFSGSQFSIGWDTPHVNPQQVQDWVSDFNQPSRLHQIWSETALRWLKTQTHTPVPICLASVVPAQTQHWAAYPVRKLLTLADVGLKGMYPTLGIDRALALWGAGQTSGFPHLVIDAGTALTLSGGDSEGAFVGGAILPGLRTQFQALSAQTAQLPWVQGREEEGLPKRWARDTESAIASGIHYTIIAGIQDFIQDWRVQYPESPVTLTGGDANWLYQALAVQNLALQKTLRLDSNLIFGGIRACYWPVSP